MSVNIIASDLELSKLCAELNTAKSHGFDVIAMDTEFMRESTYYPKLALIQIANNDDSWVIDPLTITQWQPFITILQDVSMVKVFHACMEDLEVLLHHLGCLASPLFDTQIAATIFSVGEQMGYARLVEQQFGEQLSKSATRSDWLQRPLTQQQLIYAVDDVAWLLPLYQQFQQMGGESPELWKQCLHNCEQQLIKAQQPKIHDMLHKKIANRKKLSIHQEYLLQQMCIWREHEAQQSDAPKGWVIKDKHLLKLCKLAEQQTLTKQTLFQLEGYSKIAIKRFGQKVIDQLNQLQQTSNSLHIV